MDFFNQDPVVHTWTYKLDKAAWYDSNFGNADLEWQANINDIGAGDIDCRETTKRKPQIVRLLQIDIAIRDKRADSTTGWIFGTFSYDATAATAPGATAMDRMVPVGIMWGNDPHLDQTAFDAGVRVRESWINPAIRTPQHLGWLGRLNGPVDNPQSSCLSCHATAQVPSISSIVPNTMPGDPRTMRWFRNIPAGGNFDARAIGTDYALQVAFGIQNYRLWKSSQGGVFAPKPGAVPIILDKDAATDVEFPTIAINGQREYVITRGQ
jgi:hypothetical protein